MWRPQKSHFVFLKFSQITSIGSKRTGSGWRYRTIVIIIIIIFIIIITAHWIVIIIKYVNSFEILYCAPF